MKKVLIIARAFPPFFPVGHSIRAIKFIKYLPTFGWQPAVLTINDQKEYESSLKVGSKALLSEIQSDVNIYRTIAGEPSLEFLEEAKRLSQRNWLIGLILKVFGKGRRWIFRNLLLPDRSITWLPFALKRGRQIINNEGINIIFATCPPHSSALIGALLKLFTNKYLVLDYRDDWIDTPWFNSKPALFRHVERRMEYWAVKAADKIVLVTEWSRNAFLKRYPKEPVDKFILIPNGCDLNDFTSLIPSPSKLDPNSRFTILHAGSLNESKNWGRNVSGLFQAIHNLLDQQPEMRKVLGLVFAGDLPDDYLSLAKQMGISDIITWVGHLPHDKVLALIKSSDLLLAINYDGWSTLIPGKIYEYWAAGGAPILLLSCPGVAAEFVNQHHLGLSVEPFDISGIQQAIQTVFFQSQTLEPMRIESNGVEVYDRKALTCQLAQIFSDLCDNKIF